MLIEQKDKVSNILLSPSSFPPPSLFLSCFSLSLIHSILHMSPSYPRAGCTSQHRHWTQPTVLCQCGWYWPLADPRTLRGLHHRENLWEQDSALWCLCRPTEDKNITSQPRATLEGIPSWRTKIRTAMQHQVLLTTPMHTLAPPTSIGYFNTCHAYN